MVVMSILFILLLACSVAALAVTQAQQKSLIAKAWNSTVTQRKVVEKKFDCCGLDKDTYISPGECSNVRLPRVLCCVIYLFLIYFISCFFKMNRFGQRRVHRQRISEKKLELEVMIWYYSNS